LQGTCSPVFASDAAFVRAFTLSFAHASHGIRCRRNSLGSFVDLMTSSLEAVRHEVCGIPSAGGGGMGRLGDSELRAGGLLHVRTARCVSASTRQYGISMA
jgi:hypothetical protein